MRTHVVKAGECIASIAHELGVPLEALVQANAVLEAERGELGILAAGDVVNVPFISPKTERVDGSGSHRIRLHRAVNPVTIRFTRMSGQPRPAEPVVLEIDGFDEEQTRTTDADGCATFMIPARARTGRVLLGDNRFAMPVTFGDLDPLSTVRGVQSRLKHLGYYSRAVDGELGPWTYQALRAFQRDNRLEPTDEIDDQTRAKLLMRAGA
jgi:N-acetylmuramoyl-L-alanine amidase